MTDRFAAFHPSEAFAVEADALDPLRHYRSRFYIPRHSDGNDAIYLCGNSLGLQPKTTERYIFEELEDWRSLGVEGHVHARHPWLPYHEFLTEQTARLVGALPLEVVVMNNLTVNLHLLMISFYRPTKERYKIIIEQNAFPSDQYAVKSQARFHCYDENDAIIELRPREGEHTIRTDDVIELLEREGDSIALILLGGVNYYTGQAFEMDRITDAGHRKGIVVAFDLAHAAGNLVLRLHDWDVDFAAWCSYKYLNAGPGSTAGAFVHERHAYRKDIPRFAGWWGHDKAKRFLMGPNFDPIPGAEGWQLSNPSIFPLAALRASMDIFDEAGMDALRAKSERLTAYTEFLLSRIENPSFAILTPSDPMQRGAQISIQVGSDRRDIFDRLANAGIICDWREPDVIRIAPVPLYNTFSDVYHFVQTFYSSL